MNIKNIHTPSPIKTSPYGTVNWSYLCGAMETLLSLGDIQKDNQNQYSTNEFCEIALRGIEKIIQFKACAIYMVESETSDLKLAALNSDNQQDFIESEFNFLIDQGAMAWAIRERRGITVFSKEKTHKLVLHVIATYARIRGVFIGIFPSQTAHTPNGAIEFLSLTLRSVATSLESIEYVGLLHAENDELQKQIEEKLRLLLYREREVANTRKLNAIASLAGGIAHEYNNVLTSLVGYNDLTEMHSHDSQQVQSFTQKSDLLLSRLSLLTSQLLAYSQGGRYKTEVVPLKSLIDNSLVKLKSQLRAPIRLSVRYENEEISVNGDIDQLQQVITSIIINAKEAIENQGDIQIEVKKIHIEDTNTETRLDLIPGDYVLLQVRDSGTGMDQETKDRIFEPFFSTKFQGRGLSMAAVYGILENHNGDILVESEDKAGTTIKIYLPAVEA